MGPLLISNITVARTTDLAMAAALDADARSKLQQQLMEAEGVLYAAFDPRSNELWVVRDPAYKKGPVELAVRNQIAALGHDPAGLNVRLAMSAHSGPRRRVRFTNIERVEERSGVTIRVGLEWHDEVHTGSANGEGGAAIELKTTARAAVDALEQLTGQDLDLRIIGVKPIRAFDSDLMVASLIRRGIDRQRLVGAVVVSSGPLEATALAVLSALNRTLGNVLHTAD